LLIRIGHLPKDTYPDGFTLQLYDGKGSTIEPGTLEVRVWGVPETKHQGHWNTVSINRKYGERTESLTPEEFVGMGEVYGYTVLDVKKAAVEEIKRANSLLA